MSKREYSGEPIDASWQTPPWQNDGETLDAYDSEGEGEIMTVDWPENATDPEELNDRQKKMILTAVNHPDVNSSTQLVELSGLDVSKHYPNYVLREFWPERYWAETLAHSGEDPDDITERVGELRQRLLDGDSLNQMTKEFSASQNELSRVVRGEVDDLPDVEIPPLTYLHNSEQKWVIDQREEKDGGDRAVVDTTVEELRERALNGEHATEIAESLDVTGSPVRKRLRGYQGFGADSDIPPLDYDVSTQEWYIPDDTAAEPTTTDTPPKNDAPTTPTPDPARDGTPAWVWAVLVAVGAWIVSKVLRNT